MSMLEWLNHNAGAVQGVVATVVAVLTAFLAFVTWKYVRITSQLLHLTQAQYRHSAQPNLQFDIVKKPSARGDFSIRNDSVFALRFSYVGIRPVFVVHGQQAPSAILFQPDVEGLVLMPQKTFCRTFDASSFYPYAEEAANATFVENIHYQLIVACTDLQNLAAHSYVYESKGEALRYWPHLIKPAQGTWASRIRWRVIGACRALIKKLKVKLG